MPLPKNCSFAWVSGPPSIQCSLSPPEPITQTASWSVQQFLHSSRQCYQAHLGMSFPLKIAPLHWDLDPIWYMLPWANGPIRVHNPNSISISSAVFAQLTVVSSGMRRHVVSPQKCPFTWGCEPNLACGSLGPPDPKSQTASRSGQPFMHSSRQTVRILYNCPLPPENCPFLWTIWTPIYLVHCFLRPPESTTKTAPRSVQPFFAGLTTVTDRQTMKWQVTMMYLVLRCGAA